MECSVKKNFSLRDMALKNRQETETRIMVLLGIINQLMTTRTNKLFSNAALTPSQFGVLVHFTHQPERTWMVTELATVIEMNQPGITKIVGVLEKKRLLEVQINPLDKRKRYLKITPLGLKVSSDLFTKLQPDITHTFSCWDKSELSSLHAHLEKLMHWFDENRDNIKQS
ncbi:MAG: MarR family winged helix-turn-helix transcriptional regulator [Gammaproteobacteria bacterium]|nr:MarR family winged helix-turn-helix transcriptional regulator [Gammaproteobacteria bacterium]